MPWGVTRSERDRPDASCIAQLSGSTPIRRRNSSTAACPISTEPSPLAWAPSSRRSISVCRFWLTLFTTFTISAIGGLSCAASTRMPAGSGCEVVSTPPVSEDALRGQRLREHGRGVARGILEGDGERLRARSRRRRPRRGG